MKKYYFTFEKLENFPYKNTYLTVIASSYKNAVRSFRKKHPDNNYSSCYNEEKWKEKAVQDYANQEPAEVICTETCNGEKIEGYDDLYIFVPEMRQIIRIAEGTGDNLLNEDIEDGYVDYLCYEQYELDADMPYICGGQILLTDMFRDRYGCTADCIQEVLNTAYGTCTVDFIILA